MTDNRYPSEKAERIIVRLPDGMRDHLAVLAKSNKRSVNAEVVAALEGWIEKEAAHLESQPKASDLPTLYVLLDTNGLPISWAEIHEHLGAITKAGKLQLAAMNATILTPEMASSSERQKEAMALFHAYQKLEKDPK